MTVRVDRELSVPAPPAQVWAFIADPDNRAAAISVVDEWDVREDGTAVWHVHLPIPFVNRTIPVKTRDRERNEPEHVSFVGTSRLFQVQGEHTLEPTEDGTLLRSRFVVDGKAPGVESFFKRRLDGELGNLEEALLEWLDGEASATTEAEADG